MARIRTIKPDFWTDSKTGTLSGDATKLFIGMLNMADDFGVLRYDLAELRARIFPYSDHNSCVAMLGEVLHEEIASKGLVSMFAWRDQEGVAERYLFIANFCKHQKVDHPAAPILPGMKKGESPERYARRLGVTMEPVAMSDGTITLALPREVSRDVASPREPARAVARKTDKMQVVDSVDTRESSRALASPRSVREGKVLEGIGLDCKGGEVAAAVCRVEEPAVPVPIATATTSTAPPLLVIGPNSTLEFDPTPENVTPEHLARGLCEQIGTPVTRGNLENASAAIRARARAGGETFAEAHDYIRAAWLEFGRDTGKQFGFWCSDADYERRTRQRPKSRVEAACDEFRKRHATGGEA